MKTFIRDTISLCPECMEIIQGKIYEKENHIWLEKSCAKHGAYDVIIEPDPATFHAMEVEEKWDEKNVHSLTIPVIHKCNMNCSYCFINSGTEHKELSNDEIKKIIDDFDGYVISLSGGEPTLKNDLGEIIEYAKKAGKKVCVVSNGLKLSSENYLSKLMQSGKFSVFFSLDSFKDDFYSKVKSEGRVLDLKLKAVKNLKKNKIFTLISSTIYKGLNDDEVGKIFRYCINNKIFELRLRNAQSIGRNTGEYTGYYLSELINLFCEQTGFKNKTILYGAKWWNNYYYQYTVGRIVRFIKIGKKFIPLNIQEDRMNKILKQFFYLMIKLKIVRSLFIRFIHWPTAETIISDGIVKKGVGHLYNKQAYNFCHALILQEKL